MTPDADYYDLRLEQIERLGIAGFVTENSAGMIAEIYTFIVSNYGASLLVENR